MSLVPSLVRHHRSTVAPSRATDDPTPTPTPAPSRPAPPARGPVGSARSVPTRPAGSPTGWVALALGGGGVALLAGRVVGLHPPGCALVDATGVACPVCGITRVAAHLVGGQPHVALGRDPLGVALVLALAAVAVAQVGALRGRPVAWLGRAVVPVTLALVGLARWGWLVAIGGPPG